jgi:hypothetical protein
MNPVPSNYCTWVHTVHVAPLRIGTSSKRQGPGWRFPILREILSINLYMYCSLSGVTQTSILSCTCKAPGTWKSPREALKIRPQARSIIQFRVHTPARVTHRSFYPYMQQPLVLTPVHKQSAIAVDLKCCNHVHGVLSADTRHPWIELPGSIPPLPHSPPPLHLPKLTAQSSVNVG